MKSRRYRIVYNDDGGSIHGVLNVEELLQKAVDPLAGTHVDAFFWCVGGNDVYIIKTEAGEVWGGNATQFDTVYQWEEHQTLKRLLESPRDYVEALSERSRKTEMDFFLSFRMNDIHDGPAPFGGDRVGYSEFKKKHPEFLMGDAVHAWFKTAHDFKFPEVREHKLAIIEEAISRYATGLDGIELDFQRHHYYFLPEEAYRNRYLITDMVRRVRKCLDDVGARRDNRLSLAIRVPSTFEIASRTGFDVQTWLDEELIDILIAATPAGAELNLPVKEFVEATRGTACQLLACLGWYVPPPKARAAALNYWKAGVDGIYLFNWFATGESRREPSVMEIGDPELIARKDKHYVVDRRLAEPWTIANPEAQLPLSLQRLSSGGGAIVSFVIGDDLDSAVSDNALEDVKLKLRLENLAKEDVLEFKLNGSALGTPSVKPVKDASGTERELWWEFSLQCPPLKSGANRLEAIIESRNPSVTCPLLLSNVEVLITYKK